MRINCRVEGWKKGALWCEKATAAIPEAGDDKGLVLGGGNEGGERCTKIFSLS